MQKKLISLFLVVASLMAVLGLVWSVDRLGATDTAVTAGAPPLISYQGILTDSGGEPISGTVTLKFGVYAAASGGAPLWEETQSGVPVSDGSFSVLLGSVQPLTTGLFDDPTRYLQVSVDVSDGGGSFTDLPRQQLASVPYALQAEQAEEAVQADTALQADTASQADTALQADTAAQADTADSAPWSGLTGVPAGFADGSDDGAQYANIIHVAKSGGDYTSVADALDSIGDAAANNPYLVAVAPGVYTETNLVAIPGYVHLRGSGENATKIVSTRSASTQGNNSATVDLGDNGRISHLTVANSGADDNYAIAIYSAETTRATVIEQVTAVVDGDGGVGHFAVYLNDAEPIIKNSTLMAGGAAGFGTAVNAALGSVNISGGFPQALIENSILMGGAASNQENCNDPTGTGFGLQLSESSPMVRESYICGGHRGIAVYVNGNVQVQSSSVKVSTSGGAFLFEISASGSIKLANSGVSYLGNKFTGTGVNGLSCVHTYDLGTYAPLTDATNNSATACN
jgi:hypothetical protein